MSQEILSLFPKEINALISCYLRNKEGKYFRDQTGDFIIKEIKDGDTYGNGVLHSFNDMPAVIDLFGTQSWYKNGKIHRDNNLPARIWNNRNEEWFQNGIYHRDNDMPAIIWSDGREFFYKNGIQYKN